MPPPGAGDSDAIRRQIRDAEFLGTALERSYSAAKIAAVNMLEKINSEGDATFQNLKDQIIDSVTNGSKEAAENLLSSLTEAASRAPKDLKKHFDQIAAMAARSSAAAGGAPGAYTRY